MNRTLRHLLWKDTRMIAPLVAVILAGTLVFYLMRWVASWSNSYLSNVDLAVSLWMLMPNLMALGAPPMLVGSEEESGTLGWLRSLPIPWPLVVVSKALVAVVAVVLSWTLSSLLLWTAMGGEKLPMFAATLLQSHAILGAAFFSLQLLSVGFFLAYLCRSPILGLILLVPSIIGLNFAVSYAWWLLNVVSDPSGLWWAGRMVIAVAYAVLLVLLPLLPASWRLARRRSRKSLAPPPALDSRRPQPYATSAMLSESSRPGIWRALIWQAWRQQSRPLIGLFLIAALCIIVLKGTESRYAWTSWMSSNRDFIVGASFTLLMLACTWIGALCFYSDSILRRHFFLADRGFPKLQVWWSRLAAPSLAIAIVWLVLHAIRGGDGVVNMDDYRSVQACCGLGFTCGLLASIWMGRSTLAFFVGPVLLIGIFLCTMLVLAPYQQGIPYNAIAAIPLLFASWRLTGDWLKQTQGWMTQLRVVGYVLLAIGLIPVTFFVVRFGTMPKPLPQWRAEILAQPMPKAFKAIHFDSRSSIEGYLKPWLATHPLPIRVNDSVIDRPQLLWEETHGTLSSPPNGQKSLLDRAESAQRILEWAKAARLAVLEGEISPNVVLQYADSDELAAMGQMYNQLTSGVRLTPSSAAAIRAAMSEMASEELREESWRTALAMEWRLYQSRRGNKIFAGEFVDVGYWFPGLEQLRADRNVDNAVYTLLESPLADRPSPNIRAATRRIYGRSYNLIELDIGDAAPHLKAEILQELKQRGL